MVILYGAYPLIFRCASHLYKRVCPSVGPLVRWTVGPSVHNAFVKIAENGVMQDRDASYVMYTALLYLTGGGEC